MGTLAGRAEPAERGHFSLRLSQHGDWSSPEIRSTWGRLIAACDGAGVVEKSPEFLDYLLSTHDPSRFHLATVRDDAGSLVGVVPLRVTGTGLRVAVSGQVLWESRARAVTVLGGEPLLPADPAPHDVLFAAIEAELPDYPAIALPAVPVDGFLADYLKTSTFIKDKFTIYSADGVRGCHSIPLPATVGEYRAKMSGKRRYNLRRQAKLLRDHGRGGRLELMRVESPHQVGELVEAVNAPPGAGRLSRWGRADPLVVDRLEAEEFARRGLLLTFLLMCGGRPCAALTGLQYRGVYYLEGIPRDRALDRVSPGSTALHLAIEDLILNTSIRRIDLGFGEPAYSHSSTNVVEARASLLLLRRTASNRLRRLVHAASGSVVGLAKRYLEDTRPRE
jgi:CelD/BcsL family acetyltransferase involved in cellulose biosynthesis